MTHQFNPDRRPDDDFEPAEIRHLVAGNEGRLTDFRRTPIRMRGVESSKEARARHIIARLGYLRAWFNRAGLAQVVLYRGIAGRPPLTPHRNNTFVSTSFRKEVAESLFEAASAGDFSVLYQQSVPVDRLFMTYLETAEMNRVYLESEAVVLFEEGNQIF